MGDWALAQFDAKGLTYGTEYTTWPTPGTDGMFDFLARSHSRFRSVLRTPAARRTG